ncbi:MAG TPA: ASKHA domain-containing protein [Anaerolineales bacterium]
MTGNPRVVALPSGRSGHVPSGTSLRTALRGLGVAIESICAENATCGKCKVLVEEGVFAAHGIESTVDHLSPARSAEQDYVASRHDLWARRGWNPRRVRLACQAGVIGDVVVTVPEESLTARQVVRKSANERYIEVRPSLRKYLVEMSAPSLANPKADWGRLASGTATSIGLVRSGETGLPSARDLTIDYRCLQELPATLRASNWRVTVTVWQDREVVRVEPGFDDRLFGAAVDVGTTTVALYLCDLMTGAVVATESDANPQIAFGEDVMSRIQFTATDPDGLQRLHKCIIKAVNQLLVRACASANISAADVMELVMVGNTTMQHLFLDLPPKFLGMAPFAPATSHSIDIKGRALGLVVNKSANVHVLPSIASFIGADTAGVLLAEEPHSQAENWLIIDIGTNAELILGNSKQLFCASTPTGPALEGAHIEHGMRAAPGAIEHIHINALSMETEWKIVGETEWGAGSPRGMCGSAVIDAVSELLRAGVIDSTGRLLEVGAANGRIRNGISGREFVIAWAGEASTGIDICLTQKDIRQIQLAKSALFVAAQALLELLGIDAPDKLLLAGAFGSYIDKGNAMAIGMLPRMDLHKVFVVGNAAGDGARIALLNLEKRREAPEVAARVTRHELPADPAFQDRFIKSLAFPEPHEQPGRQI